MQLIRLSDYINLETDIINGYYKNIKNDQRPSEEDIDKLFNELAKKYNAIVKEPIDDEYNENEIAYYKRKIFQEDKPKSQEALEHIILLFLSIYALEP
jgi:hypothetical protein